MNKKPKKYAFGGIAGAPTTPNPGMGVTPPMGRPTAPPGRAISEAAHARNALRNPQTVQPAQPMISQPLPPAAQPMAMPTPQISEAARMAPGMNNAGSMPAFKKGGFVPPWFKGKESKKEEMSEATAIKKGKMSPKQYAKGEANEPKPKRFANGGSVCRGAGAASRGTGFREY